MSGLLVGDDFAALFTTFQYSALRLETRDNYAMADEAEPFRRFVSGQPVPVSWLQPWLTLVSAAVASGRQFRRVRIVPGTLTDYLRFELWLCQFNAEAGEDIAYLSREHAAGYELPEYDYWLFDNERLARMHFDDAGHLLGAEVVIGSGPVEEHVRAWEVARSHAVPYAQYAARHPMTATIE